MANKRMISRSIIDSDAFLDLPKSSQLAYFHIIMRADDEGAFDSVRRLCREIRIRERDIDALCDAGFIVRLSGGVVMVKDWSSHNAIKKDRFTKSKYHDEIKKQNAGDIEEIREKWSQNGTKTEPKRSQDGDILEPQNRIGKVREGKNRLSIGKVSEENMNASAYNESLAVYDTLAEDDKPCVDISLSGDDALRSPQAYASEGMGAGAADGMDIPPYNISRVTMEELRQYADQRRKKNGGSGA